jgi:hypothetical protein
MTNEQIKEKYGIELIGKEMWVWDNDPEKAFLWLVIYKKPENKFPYITIDKDGDADYFKYASETNPNEPKQPQVGDVGYFWDEENEYIYSKLRSIYPGDSLPYFCSLELWFSNFSHEKQPWMI